MIAIIGAGISGLSTAFHLQQKGIPYTLLEASDRVGGNIETVKKDDYVLEKGPNSLLCDRTVLDILEKAGLNKSILYPEEVNKNRFIYRKGTCQFLLKDPKN